MKECLDSLEQDNCFLRPPVWTHFLSSRFPTACCHLYLNISETSQPTTDSRCLVLPPFSLHNQQLNSSRRWRQKQNCCPLSIVLCPVSLIKCQSLWCFACPCFLKLNCLQPKHFFPSVFFFWGGGPLFSLSYIALSFSKAFSFTTIQPHECRVFICFLRGCIPSTQDGFQHEDG